MRHIVTGLAMLWAAGLAAQPADWLREWPRTDFDAALVALSEIRSGGPPKDGIPSIDDPRIVSVAEAARWHPDLEPVLSVEHGGEARAYPLSLMMWHEIVNDRLGGLPIAATYCPLCNSGAVFVRRVDGEETTFGTTGKLRHSDLVMYDRLTESWWQQFEGRAILGARAGDMLTRVPARLESFAQFAARRPGGTVVRPPVVQRRDYGRNPYVGYDSAARPFLYDGTYDGPGSPMMRVVSIPGRAEAVSFALLRREREILLPDPDGDLVLRWRPGQASALDAAQVAEGRDVGSVTVTRAGRDVAHDTPFAFAHMAFNPGGSVRHVAE